MDLLEERDHELETLRASAVLTCRKNSDPNAVARELAKLKAPPDVLADLLLFACASDSIYLRMYGHAGQVLCAIVARGGACLGSALVARGLREPRRHTHELLADLVDRGAIPRQSLPASLPPPLRRRLDP